MTQRGFQLTFHSMDFFTNRFRRIGDFAPIEVFFFWTDLFDIHPLTVSLSLIRSSRLSSKTFVTLALLVLYRIVTILLTTWTSKFKSRGLLNKEKRRYHVLTQLQMTHLFDELSKVSTQLLAIFHNSVATSRCVKNIIRGEKHRNMEMKINDQPTLN